MKNVYNSVEHYLTFLKTAKGVTVEQPQLKQRLDNISGLLEVYKKGAQKKIGKERQQKTCRNVQEGLPFTIDEMKIQVEDPNLV